MNYFRTSFFAPNASCFQMPKSWMTDSIKEGIPNNFFNKMKSDGKQTIMWGFEQFVIESWIERDSGKIIRATMENDLIMRMKVGCDDALESCAAEFPFQIHRSQRLKLQ